MAICPSTTSRFSPMPPTVIQQSDGMVGGVPHHPAPLPNMPTAEMVTVPQVFFHVWGYLLPIQVETQKYGRKSQAGRNSTALEPPTSAFAMSCTWAALIS